MSKKSIHMNRISAAEARELCDDKTVYVKKMNSFFEQIRLAAENGREFTYLCMIEIPWRFREQVKAYFIELGYKVEFEGITQYHWKVSW